MIEAYIEHVKDGSNTGFIFFKIFILSDGSGFSAMFKENSKDEYPDTKLDDFLNVAEYMSKFVKSSDTETIPMLLRYLTELEDKKSSGDDNEEYIASVSIHDDGSGEIETNGYDKHIEFSFDSLYELLAHINSVSGDSPDA